MLSGNSLRQTVHTHCASVHQAVKLAAALLRFARITAGLAEVMADYCQVYDSCHLQVDYKEPGSAPEPYALLSSMGYLYLITAYDQFRLCKHTQVPSSVLHTPYHAIS